MSRLAHRIYISTLVTITIFVTLYILIKGLPYYQTPLAERFYHPSHDLFKPSGLLGHGMGVFGSLCILIGVLGYMIRKRSKYFSRLGLIKHWLEFHIFLCTLGPILVLFHTTFKFGGMVAVSFWSMVAVVASGVLGRFIYLQIPRSIEGRALNLQEVKEMKDRMRVMSQPAGAKISAYQWTLSSEEDSDLHGINIFSKGWKIFLRERAIIQSVKLDLKNNQVAVRERRDILRLLKSELALNRRIEQLTTMQQIFRYWHVAHLPFAIVMLVIMIIHVLVALAFGSTWIF